MTALVSRRGARGAACLVAFLCATNATSFASNPIPKRMLGTWAHGSCASAANRLTITKSGAALGTEKPQAIVYYADDAGPGNGAIHWAKEGEVDNFVYASAQKAIVYNAQGYHMPGQVLYKRCSPSNET